MKLKTVLLLFLLLYINSTAWAMMGHETGNGGDGVVCRDRVGKIFKLELLDYYLAKELYGEKIDLGKSENYLDLINIALTRLEKFSPTRVSKYRNWLSTLIKDSHFLKDTVLVDIPDSAHDFGEVGCKVEQIVHQRSVLINGDRRFTFNDDLWSLLPVQDKAGLILHELIYREAIKMRHKDSKKVRRFVSLISSKKIEEISLYQYAGAVQKYDMGYIEVDGLIVKSPYVNSYRCPVMEECINGMIEPTEMLFGGRTYLAENSINLSRVGRINCIDVKEGTIITVNKQEEILAHYNIMRTDNWSLCRNSKDVINRISIISKKGYKLCKLIGFNRFSCKEQIEDPKKGGLR